MMWAIVSTPPSWVATSTEPHVSHPKPGSAWAATWTMMIITQETSASCARLKKNLITGSRRRSSAITVPLRIATNACVPLAKISASASGTSVSEKECELRRNSSSTGQRSHIKTIAARTAQTISGAWIGS